MQDHSLERLKGRPRLEPELFTQHPARVSVDVQRLGLAPRSIEREHQLGAEALAQRVRQDQRLDLRDQLLVVPEGQICVDPLHQGKNSQFLQAPDLRLREVQRPHVRQWGTPPQRERLA
jgi:hypothetical protein